MAKKLEGAGLRGQVAGQTSLSTVGKEGHGLTYRGYAIEDLADKAKKLRAQGYSVSEIAEDFGVSKGRIYEYLK